MGGVPVGEAGLDVEHRHVSPAGRVAVGGPRRPGGARLVLDQLEEGLHVGPHPGHDPGPDRLHRLLVAALQGLQQRAVVPAVTAESAILRLRSHASAQTQHSPVGEVGGDLHHLSDGVGVGARHGADVQTAVAILLNLSDKSEKKLQRADGETFPSERASPNAPELKGIQQQKHRDLKGQNPQSR